MYIVYKIKHYIGDDTDVEHIGVYTSKKKAKKVAENFNGQFTEVPYFGE